MTPQDAPTPPTSSPSSSSKTTSSSSSKKKNRRRGRPPKDERPADNAGVKDFQVTADEAKDWFVDIFELLAEAVGEEWKVSEKRCARLGKRWSRLANRWINSVESELAVSVVLKVFLIVAVVEVVCVFGARIFKTVKRVRDEREQQDDTDARTIEGMATPADNVASIN